MTLHEQLHKLKLVELNIMLEHLRLGLDHLKKLLNRKQYKELLQWHKLSEIQKGHISSDSAEIWGNAALVLNTIITSTFGAWMGLSGCMGFSLGSPITLAFVTSFAFLLSGIIGYNSFKLTKQKAVQAINNQIIYNLQLEILKVINEKLEKKIKKITGYLNSKLGQLERPLEKNETELIEGFYSKEEVFNWYDRLNECLSHKTKAISHPELYEVYFNELSKILAQIKKIIYKDVELLEKLSIEPEQASRLLQDKTIPFIKILTNPILANPEHAHAPGFWMKGHVTDIALGLAPTLFGGFASMFVFVGGIPNLSKELGLLNLFYFVTHPYARAIELTLAASLTTYFGFSHLYSSRKAIQRNRLLENTQKQITNQETLLIEKNTHLLTLQKLKTKIYKVLLVCNFIDKTCEHINQIGHEPNTLEDCQIEAQQLINSLKAEA